MRDYKLTLSYTRQIGMILYDPFKQSFHTLVGLVVLKHRRPKLTIRGVIMFFFLRLCECSAKCDMGHILLPNMPNVTLALQHMEVLCYNGLKVCMGTQ